MILSGNTFDLENLQYDTFESTVLNYEKHDLFFYFESQVPYRLKETEAYSSLPISGQVFGYGKVRFTRGAKISSSYSGHYIVVGDSSIYTVQGERIADPKICQKLENHDEKVAFMKLYIEKILSKS